MSGADIPSVWAAGQLWRIRVADHDIFVDGYCDQNKSEILINQRWAKANGAALRKLVLHELLHAVDYSAGMLHAFKTEPHDGFGGEVLYSKDENGKELYVKPFCLSERLVCLFSESLWMTFSDPRNADFMKWLLEDVWAEAWRLFAPAGEGGKP